MGGGGKEKWEGIEMNMPYSQTDMGHSCRKGSSTIVVWLLEPVVIKAAS